MGLLNSASAVMIGDRAASALYLGGTKVWGGSASLTAQVPPTGFGAVPFGAEIFKSSNGDFSTTFDPQCPLVEGASGVSTYYVDVATGSDSNPGTASLPFKTIQKACTISRGVAPNMLLKVKGGVYTLTQNFSNSVPQPIVMACVSWDGEPVICSNEVPIAGWTLDSSDTYYASVAGYGYANNRSSAWDGSIPDPWGDYAPLKPVASLAACKAAAGTYWMDSAVNARIYVHTADGRAPDADIHVFEAWAAPGQFRDFGGAPAETECYFENFHFIGGASAFTMVNAHATNVNTGVFKGCTFKYNTSNYVVQVQGVVEVAFIDCIASCGHGDVISYHSYGANPAPRALEINCEARLAGCILAGTANQGSTMHDGGKIVRLNGSYHHNENDQVADVSANTKTWMLGCTAQDGLKPGYANYRCGNGAGGPEMWLDGCSSDGSTYDITSDAGAIVLTRNFTGTSGNSGSGTIGTY